MCSINTHTNFIEKYMELSEERKQLWYDYIKAVRTKNSDLAQKTMHELSKLISRSIINNDKDNQEQVNNVDPS